MGVVPQACCEGTAPMVATTDQTRKVRGSGEAAGVGRNLLEGSGRREAVCTGVSPAAATNLPGRDFTLLDQSDLPIGH